ncbi:MAG: hypothetical protein HN641_13315 [Candidatus Marinimicrobia bacterium]|jgi:hypothetical protein|nr:hypothetical protein [Candidatus Neomarinimicrobiota bacterium]
MQRMILLWCHRERLVWTAGHSRQNVFSNISGIVGTLHGDGYANKHKALTATLFYGGG